MVTGISNPSSASSLRSRIHFWFFGLQVVRCACGRFQCPSVDLRVKFGYNLRDALPWSSSKCPRTSNFSLGQDLTYQFGRMGQGLKGQGSKGQKVKIAWIRLLLQSFNLHAKIFIILNLNLSIHNLNFSLLLAIFSLFIFRSKIFNQFFF